jgi:transposase
MAKSLKFHTAGNFDKTETVKGNRKTQSEFVCKHCGHTENASLNIQDFTIFK